MQLGKRILIIGLQRSGTTLLRRIIENHPDISFILHEKRLLKRVFTEQEVFEKTRRYKPFAELSATWGEKVPWYGKPEQILRYAKKWLDMFGERAIILHIIRHPADIAISHTKVRFGPNNMDSVIKCWKESVPVVVNKLAGTRTILISFENLVKDPFNTIYDIITFCKINNDKIIIEELVSLDKNKLRYFDCINSERAFAYIGKNGINLKTKLPKYIELMNLWGAV
jgi:hypothetical protein